MRPLLAFLAATTLHAEPPALFTATQAKAATALYLEQCGDCHGANLTGAAGPALSGDGFWSGWSGKTARNLYSRILTSMPAGNPGSLTEKETLYLVIYILQGNGYPTGETTLSSANQLNNVLLERTR